MPTTIPQQYTPASPTTNVQYAEIPTTATRVHAERKVTIQPSPTSEDDGYDGEPIMVAQYYHTTTSDRRPEEVTKVVDEYTTKENHRLDQLETGDEPRDQLYLLCLRTLYGKTTIVHLPYAMQTYMNM